MVLNKSTNRPHSLLRTFFEFVTIQLMSKDRYVRGFIGANSYSDRINLNVIKEHIDYYASHPEIGYKLEAAENRKVIPHFVIQATTSDWYDGQESSLTLRLIELIKRQQHSQLRSSILNSLSNPESFAFRAFQRSHGEKQKYRLIGLDLDHDVLDYNLETEGAEYSALYTKEAYYNMSFNLDALMYFNPYLHLDDNFEPKDVLRLTASSYLQIYARKGIEKGNGYWTIKVTDGEPLARKRKYLLRIDWKLPDGLQLPPCHGN